MSWVLIDSEAPHDRSQVLVEKELEMVWRVIDVHRNEPHWLLAVLMKCLDSGSEAKRRDTPLLRMACTSLVGTGESRSGLRMAAHPHLGTGEYSLPTSAERLTLAAKLLDEKITVHTLNLLLRLSGRKPGGRLPARE